MTEKADERPGAWFVWDWDMSSRPMALFDNELDACRWVVRSGYGKVTYWPFGDDWSEVFRSDKA